MNIKEINWFGLAGSIATLILVVISIVYTSPWWQLSIGQELASINLSPLNFNMDIFGTNITIPLLWFINLAFILSFIACAVALLIYSIFPNRGYSENLLNFAYKRPLVAILFFLIFLFAGIALIGFILRFNIPIIGSTITTMTMGNMSIKISITTGFTWVFWLAIAAAALCIAAKVYHRKMIMPKRTSKPPTSKS